MSLYLEHITQRFGQTLALNDIDLEIRNGEFLAILGPCRHRGTFRLWKDHSFAGDRRICKTYRGKDTDG